MESNGRSARNASAPPSTGNQELAPSEFLEVAEGVYAWIQPDGTWWINNAGLVVGDESALLVDTCTTERRTRELLTNVERVSDGKPLRYAVNTHHHGDHTFGNSLLSAETRLIGHHRMRDAMLADHTLESFPPYWSPRPDFGELYQRAPDLSVDSGVAAHLGGRCVEVVHPGFVAHTAGDLVAWVPDVRVLFVGDLLFPGHTPMLLAGAPTGAIQALDWIASFDAEVVVPGHGAVIEQGRIDEVLAVHRRYYRFVLAEAARGIEAGLTPLDLARTADLGEFTDLLDPERFVLNAHSAYAELTGGTADRANAFADVMTWLGAPIGSKV